MNIPHAVFLVSFIIIETVFYELKFVLVFVKLSSFLMNFGNRMSCENFN